MPETTTRGWTDHNLPSVPKNKTHNLAVFIGRFQPCHLAHIQVIKDALDFADKVLIIIGSSYRARDYKNPWREDEREAMLRMGLLDAGVQLHRVIFRYSYDTRYNDGAWLVRTGALVDEVLDGICDIRLTKPKVTLVGHKKPGDETTWYLDMFPQWDRTEHELIEEPLNATDVRDLYFQRGSNLRFLEGVLPKSVKAHLMAWRETEQYEEIVKLKEFIVDYKKQFAGLKHGITHLTADAIVVQNAHVLLVKRGNYPGIGQWALPGGFFSWIKDMSTEDTAIRELTEEVKIDLPEKLLRGSIEKFHEFAHPDRSLRGRTVTWGYYIPLPNGNKLPKVKPGFDPDQPDEIEILDVRWVPLTDIKPEEMFEDHYEIIQYFVGVLE